MATLTSIELSLVGIQINGKKMSSAVFAQIPFIDFCAHIESAFDLYVYPDEVGYEVICRVNKMAAVKSYREKVKLDEPNHMLRGRADIDNRVNAFFENVECLILWQTSDGQLALHRQYKDVVTVPRELSYLTDPDLKDEWSEVFHEFENIAQDKPVALIGA